MDSKNDIKMNAHVIYAKIRAFRACALAGHGARPQLLIATRYSIDPVSH